MNPLQAPGAGDLPRLPPARTADLAFDTAVRRHGRAPADSVTAAVRPAGEGRVEVTRTHAGAFAAMPAWVQDGAAGLLRLPVAELSAPGRTVLAATRMGADGSEAVTNAGLIAQADGTRHGGAAHPVTALLAWGGTEPETILRSAKDTAAARGTHLVIQTGSAAAAAKLLPHGIDWVSSDALGGHDEVEMLARLGLDRAAFEALPQDRRQQWRDVAAAFAGGRPVLMGAATPGGPKLADGLAEHPHTLYLSGAPTQSIGTVQGARPIDDPAATLLQPAPRDPAPYRFRASDAGLAALDPAQRSPGQRLAAARQAIDRGFETAGAKVDAAKQAVVEAATDTLWTPLARSAPGKATLARMASGEIDRIGTSPNSYATQATPQATRYRAVPGENPRNGAAPLYPGTGSTSPLSPGTLRMETTLKMDGALTFKHGPPAGIPMSYWAGSPGMAFGRPLDQNYALRKELVAPMVGALKVVQGTMTAGAALATTTLLIGTATGSLQAGHIVTGDKGLTPAQDQVDRITNFPKGVDEYYVRAKVPFTPEAWKMEAGAVLGIRLKPFEFNAAYVPGQRGVAPWANITDGRPTAVFQYTAGVALAFGELYVGNKNYYVDHALIVNIPRITKPIITANALPTADRRSPLDVMVGLQVSPLSLVAARGVSVGKSRYVEGALLSTVVVRPELGTKGAGLATKVGPPDVLRFATVSINPSYSPEDPVAQSASHTLDGLKRMLPGNKPSPGK